MQITKKQKQQLIDLNDSRVNGILNVLEAGVWYNYSGSILNYQGRKNDLIQAYGYVPHYGWYDNPENFGDDPRVWIKATKQEIEQALIDEAKKRGFKEGVRVKLFDSIFSTSVLKREDFTYQEDYNRLGIIGGDEDGSYAVLFKDGQWAEIIDEKAELKQEIKELRNKLKSLEEKL